MQQFTLPPAPKPAASASINKNTSSNRKISKQAYVQDRRSTIGQAQISEIQKLTQELVNCKNQNRIVTTSNIDHTCVNRLRNNSNTQSGSNQTLRQIVIAGEQHRQELIAAQDKRNLILRQSKNIQKQFNEMAREKDILFAQINNQRSKTSILQQELFITKDTLQKFRQHFDAERLQMSDQVKTLKNNNLSLEQLVKELAAKANLLPFYEQKISESQKRVNLMSHQIQQVKAELKYYQEKSNYFENNYTVLNENFNNLYNLNFSTNITLKQCKSTNTNLETALKTLQQECKQLGNRCLELADDKNRQIGELNQRIAQQSERVKVQNEELQTAVNKNDMLIAFLQDSQKTVKQVQKKNDLTRKQMENQSNELHSQKIVNKQLLTKIKQMEASYQKKEVFWKDSIANEILKMSNQSTMKLLTVSSELIKSEENAKNVSVNLGKYQSEINCAKQRISQLELQLSQSKAYLQEKQKEAIILQETLHIIKQEGISLKNSITQYEKKLSTALDIHQQTNFANKLTIEEKSQKIKELQHSLKQQQAEIANTRQNNSKIMLQIAKSTQLISLLTNELQFSKELVENYKQRLNEEDRKLEWLNEQNQLKQKIIAQYSSVTEQMREKISSDHQENTNLSNKNAQLNQQIASVKQESLQKQGILISQSQLIEEKSASIKKFEEEIRQKAIIIEDLQRQKKELLKQQQTTNQKLKQLNEQLHKNAELLSNTETAYQQVINSLKLQKQAKIQQISQENNYNVNALRAQNKRLEMFSQQMFNDFKGTMEALRAEITALQQANKLNCDEITLKTAKIQEQNSINRKLKDQNAQKATDIEKLELEIKEMTKVVEQRTVQKQELQQKMVELINDCQKSIDQHIQSQKSKSNALLSEWSTEKEEFARKTNERQQTYLQAKRYLQAQLSSIKSQHQHLKIQLEGQQARNQNLVIENQLMRKSLVEMQQSLTARFQTELVNKSRLEQQQTQKAIRQIERLLSQRSNMQAEKDILMKRLAQKDVNIFSLSKENERLDQIIRRNIQMSKSENQLLKKTNIQLQVELQRAVQASKIQSKTKNELSKSISGLQLRNVFLEGCMEKTQGELESIHRILGELKEQRDLLIRKYVILTNQLSKINSKDVNLNRELDSFAQYFSKVSALHTQINKHLCNMNQLSQQTRSSVRQPSRVAESRVEQVK